MWPYTVNEVDQSRSDFNQIIRSRPPTSIHMARVHSENQLFSQLLSPWKLVEPSHFEPPWTWCIDINEWEVIATAQTGDNALPPHFLFLWENQQLSSTDAQFHILQNWQRYDHCNWLIDFYGFFAIAWERQVPWFSLAWCMLTSLIIQIF